MNRIAALLGACACVVTSSAAVAADASHTLEIVDRVPKFEAFYAEATAKPIDADARFALWQKDYGYAAVPPGPEGQAMARKMLDAAWDRYPALLPKLPDLTAQAKADAQDAFDKINALFKTKDVPIHTKLVLFVGNFDNNAYSIPSMGGAPPTVMMEVENVSLRTVLAHELAHTVHFQLAHVQNSFGAPIGEGMFLEGLAMRVSQKVYPGLPEEAYTEMPEDRGWLKRCYANKDAVLAGIRADLDKQGREIAMKYTFGDGNTGMHREMYCAAWIVMGRLLDSGKSFAELARIPEDRMAATIKAAFPK